MTPRQEQQARRALEEAIKIAGGMHALARELTRRGHRIGAPGIDWWKNHHIPVDGRAKWVLLVEKLTGVSRHRLRPDVYPDDCCRAQKRSA